jgi:glycosyltransferase involved in cell wall biosynthesis
LQSSYELHDERYTKYTKTYYYYKKILELSTLISYETYDVGSILKDDFLGISNLSYKITNVFNGISEELVRNLNIPIKTFDNKENIVLIIGRHGIWEKNTELVFKSTMHLATEWKFIFLGPIEESFIPVIEKYKILIPGFEKKYLFRGLINDKYEYFKYLSLSKVLLLTSNKEGFPLVYSEALYFRNFIITTDVSGSAEATDSGKLGIIFPKNDYKQLETHLSKIFSSEIDISVYQDEIYNYSQKYFVWEKILSADIFRVNFKY